MTNMPVVKLFANLRKVAGTKETSITGATVAAVVSALVKRYPALGEILLEFHPDDLSGDGQIRPHVIITINGHPTANPDTPVMEHDEIAVFPPIAGG